jgi:hypothetical protein
MTAKPEQSPVQDDAARFRSHDASGSEAPPANWSQNATGSKKHRDSRFPKGFAFRFTPEEWASLRSQIATLKTGLGSHQDYLSSAFTEHGVIPSPAYARHGRSEGFCAGGTCENSPAFQRWGWSHGEISPEGTVEIRRFRLSRPFGTWPVLLPDPALKQISRRGS